MTTYTTPTALPRLWRTTMALLVAGLLLHRRHDKPMGGKGFGKRRRGWRPSPWVRTSACKHALAALGVSLAVAIGMSASATAAPLGKITEYPAPCQAYGGFPSISAGPDGNLWVSCGAEVVRITPAGSVTRFSLGWFNQAESARKLALGITTGPGGNLWFADPNGALGTISPSGQVSEFTAGLQSVHEETNGPTDIALGPDGNLWFIDAGIRAVGRITPGGMITEFTSGLRPGAVPVAIAAGRDGNIWFGVQSSNAEPAIGKITPSGQITEFPLPDANSSPADITAGPDGNLWFTDAGASPAIGRITPSGQITEFSAGLLPNNGSILIAIGAGPDGNLWFTDNGGSQAIGRITPAGVITEYSNGLAPTATAGNGMLDVTAGPDGNVWFVGKGTTFGWIGTGSGGGAAGPGGGGKTGPGGGGAHGRCTVPRLLGSTLHRAKQLLSRAHCSLGTVNKRKSVKRRRGRVLAQAPRQGRVMSHGSRVNVTVGR